MPQPFFSTLRSIETQRSGAWLVVLAITATLGAAWSAWFFFASVPVYAVSETARLEVDDAVHLVHAPVSGQITVVRASLGAHVKQGDVLFELDSVAESLQLGEQDARVKSVAPQTERVRAEISYLDRVLRESTAAAEAARNANAARILEAETEAAQAADEATRVQQLHGRGLVSELEHVKAAGERDRRATVVQTRKLEQQQQWSEHLVKTAELRARVERLQRELLELEGQMLTGAAASETLRHTVDRRVVRAPIDGRIGQLSELRPGAVIKEADRLAAVVPTGAMRVIANFSPSAAIGRIQRGQPANIRLDAFPWAQYGSLPAQVQAVADEVSERAIRVELSIQPAAASRLPVRHGLPGTAVVEVERVTPGVLMLRAVMNRLS
jgi:membrane fusion protein (multidrug efflux system)